MIHLQRSDQMCVCVCATTAWLPWLSHTVSKLCWLTIPHQASFANGSARLSFHQLGPTPNRIRLAPDHTPARLAKHTGPSTLSDAFQAKVACKECQQRMYVGKYQLPTTIEFYSQDSIKSYRHCLNTPKEINVNQHTQINRLKQLVYNRHVSWSNSLPRVFCHEQTMTSPFPERCGWYPQIGSNLGVGPLSNRPPNSFAGSFRKVDHGDIPACDQKVRQKCSVFTEGFKIEIYWFASTSEPPRQKC